MTTFLIIFTGLTLLGFAITAYVLFYWSYIPRIGFERTIHLQFDNVYSPSDSRYGAAQGASPYPYGIVSLSPEIVNVQRYDVAVELTLPRTPENTGAGNFMLEVNMFAAETVLDTPQAGLAAGAPVRPILATSRRPAILPYRSQLIGLAYKLTELHWYLLNWRSEEEKLYVRMFEAVEFAKGWRNLPSTMKLEIQSTNQMQVYSARAVFRARFKGLRWLMYNHRIVSAFVFVGIFWTTEMVFAGLAWAALTVFFGSPTQNVKAEEVHEGSTRIKDELEDDKANLSDTERTFPTVGGQQPLRYSNPRIKQEDEDSTVLPLGDGMVQAAEADDEDEDADFFLDSGLGTSMESGASRRDSIRRRRGRPSSKDEG